ncbi:MFS transporter [Corynebacterium uberis]
MTQQGGSQANQPQVTSLWKAPGYVPTLIAVACAFGAWSLLLPVIPAQVIDQGGSRTLAGATTGIFMVATVVTQVLTPRALRRFGYNPVMVAAAVTLGVPALGYLLGMSALPALLFSAIRGVGFGALTVAESALIAELVPVRLLGKASGTLGVFVGLAQMLFLPVGMAMLDTPLGFTSVCIAAAVVAVVAGVMCLRIPRIKASTSAPQDPAQRHHLPAVSTWKLVTVPALAVTSLSMSFGAVSSFLPVAVRELDAHTGAVIGGVMLSIVGGAIMALRYASGIIEDRRGRPGVTMIPGQILGGAGVALMAVVLYYEWPVWYLIIAAIAFGGGFGLVQNEALLTMFLRLPRSRVSDASAIWNASYDAGTGLGSFILGAVAAQLAYSGAFAVGAALVAVGLVLTVGDAIVGRHRITEYSNTRARLRQIPMARAAVLQARKVRHSLLMPQQQGPTVRGRIERLDPTKKDHEGQD